MSQSVSCTARSSFQSPLDLQGTLNTTFRRDARQPAHITTHVYGNEYEKEQVVEDQYRKERRIGCSRARALYR